MIILTGASGFIGRALNHKLKSLGIQTLPVCRSTLAGFHSVADYSETPDGDLLIHMAESANANVSSSENDESINITRILAKRFKSKMIYLSSSAVYGDRQPQPHNENEIPKGSSPYCQRKLKNERTVIGNGGTALRLANIFGPGVSEKTIVGRILNQLENSSDLTPLSLYSAYPIRDFLSIDELTDAISTISQNLKPGIFNIGSGDSLSISTLAKAAINASKTPSRAIQFDNTENNNSIIKLDITKVKTEFGWQPQKTSAQNIAQLIQAKENNHCEQT